MEGTLPGRGCSGTKPKVSGERVQRGGGLLSQSWPRTAEGKTTWHSHSPGAQPWGRCMGRWGSGNPSLSSKSSHREDALPRSPASERQSQAQPSAPRSLTGGIPDVSCEGWRRGRGKLKGRKETGIACGPAPAVLVQDTSHHTQANEHTAPSRPSFWNDFFTGSSSSTGASFGSTSAWSPAHSRGLVNTRVNYL